MEVFGSKAQVNDDLISKSNSLNSRFYLIKKNLNNIICMSIFPIVWLSLLIFNILLKIYFDQKNEIYCYYNITDKFEKTKLFSDDFDLDPQNIKIYVNDVEINRNEYDFDGLGVYKVKILFRSNKIKMENMFKNINTLINVTIELKDKKNNIISTSMKSMFENCNSLTSFDINGITFNVISTEKMFYNTSITFFDLSNFFSEKEINCNEMFAFCNNLTSITTSKKNDNRKLIVKNLYSMFKGSESLIKIDLSNLDTSYATDMSNMFLNCKSLTSLTIKNFELSNVEDMSYMFSGCDSLSSIEFMKTYSTLKVKNMSFMFQDCKSLKKVSLKYFTTSNLMNMSNMFSGCISATSFDFSSFDTSQVVNMEKLFYNNFNLSKLNLGKFNTCNVINMKDLFCNCSSITKLEIDKFNTSKVINMQGMFSGMKKLEELKLSSDLFDTSNVETFNSMFYTCEKLTQLNVSFFKTSNVKNFNQMFQFCTNLKFLDLSNFDTHNSNETMKNMFDGCVNLTVAIDYNNVILKDSIPDYVNKTEKK